MRLRLVLTPLLLLPLAACGGAGAASEGGTSVVASIYPLEYVTERIAGDADVSVTTLTSPGAEPHDLELTVAQTAAVIDADVIVHLGDFQSAVDDAVAQSESEHVVDAADAADLIVASEDAHEHEGEGHEEGHEEEHEEGHEGELDPHFWLDPVRLAKVAADVEAALSAADPDDAETYAANLADLERDLTSLDAEITDGLASCERDTVVVSHNAFQYWAVRYGLHMRSIAGLSPESEPSPSHVAELQELIRDEGITTVFSETLASPEMAETLSADLGLETAVLDPIEGLADETADEDYLSLMRANLAALQEANACR